MAENQLIFKAWILKFSKAIIDSRGQVIGFINSPKSWLTIFFFQEVENETIYSPETPPRTPILLDEGLVLVTIREGDIMVSQDEEVKVNP